MIPEFEESGYLPPGIHIATLDEVLERFGAGSEQREACGQSLQWLLPMCRRAGIERIILNGSFVTSAAEPGGVDCLLVAGNDFDPGSDAALAIEFGLPYLWLQVVATAEQLAYFLKVFSIDRRDEQKGLVEILL